MAIDWIKNIDYISSRIVQKNNNNDNNDTIWISALIGLIGNETRTTIITAHSIRGHLSLLQSQLLRYI